MSVSNILSENNYTGYFENLNIDGELVVNNVTIDNLTADNMTVDNSLTLSSVSTTNFNNGSTVTGSINVAGGTVNVSSTTALDIACDVNMLLDKDIAFVGGRFSYSTASFSCNVYFSSSGATVIDVIDIVLVKSGKSVTLFFPSFSYPPTGGPGIYTVDLSAIVGTRYEPLQDMSWMCAVFTGNLPANVIPGIVGLETSGTLSIYAGLSSTYLFPGAGTPQGVVGGVSFVYQSVV